MGAEQEHEYYDESSLSNVNPSTLEFEYWVSIHSTFRELYELGSHLRQSPTDSLAKAQTLSINCTKISLQVLANAYQAAFFNGTQDRTHASTIGRLTDSLFATQCEASRFPFDFARYKASVLEVATYLQFAFEHEEILQIAKEFSVQARRGEQIRLYECALGKVVIILCNTAQKNAVLPTEDIAMMMKAAAEAMIILDAIEPLGCLSGEGTKKLPTILALETIARYLENAALKDLARSLLKSVKTRCKASQDSPVERIFAKIAGAEAKDEKKTGEEKENRGKEEVPAGCEKGVQPATKSVEGLKVHN